MLGRDGTEDGDGALSAWHRVAGLLERRDGFVRVGTEQFEQALVLALLGAVHDLKVAMIAESMVIDPATTHGI